MACIGSKTVQRRRPKNHNLVEVSQMTGEGESSKKSGRKKNKNRRPCKEHLNMEKDHPKEIPSGRLLDKIDKAQKSSEHQNPSVSKASVLRKKVDPETAKYFSEISNLFEGGGIDLEERSVICGNALEETRGKELELATDTIISRTLQTLLEGCDVDQLCGFLLSCAKEFPLIAMDRSGSHVAETALRSLALNLQDKEAGSIIEEAMTKICQVVVVNPVNVMCSRYGSHVLRSLLCLCKGIPLDSLGEFHVSKSSAILSERLNGGLPRPLNLQEGFPHLLKYVVLEMLKSSREEIRPLRVNMYSSCVLQTSLKLLAGDDQELLCVIPIILGCHEETIAQGEFIDDTMVKDIMNLLKDTASSHLMEVILEVAPETLYDEIFAKIFRSSLFEISSHHCGNFVVQALISFAKAQGQMDLIWEELGPKLKELIEIGKSGVVASLLAACQRLHTHEHKCCQALASAVCSATESPCCIIPRILFLESYIFCGDKSNWKWAKGNKLHVLGCLMLQTIFRYSSAFIQPYVKSITSVEADLIFELAKDAGGGRVVEAFLCSDVSAKQKQKVIAKLRGHFGELSMRPSGSFTVEKCFTAGNTSLKEIIVSEVLAVQADLSKTKHGSYLLRKLDVDGFASGRDQWRLRQTSKQAAYREFSDIFGSKNKSQNESFLSSSSHASSSNNLKKMRKEIDQCLDRTHPGPVFGLKFPGLDISMAKLGFSGFKRHPEREDFANAKKSEEHNSKKFRKK